MDRAAIIQRSVSDQLWIGRIGQAGPTDQGIPAGCFVLAAFIWNKVSTDANDTADRRLINANHNQ
jgi:hypothetical protein